MLGAALDLLFGSSCVGCRAPGVLLCTRCRPELAAAVQPVPVPDPGPPAFAAASYAGLVRAVLIGHKEHRLLGLAAPLGELLAASVLAAAEQACAPGEPVLLVPVPSRAATIRSRGHDPLGTLVRLAASALRAQGNPVRVARLLRLRAGVADQAGLAARERHTNLEHAMRLRERALRRHLTLLCGPPPARIIVCDDVLTTGSTLREAVRALAARGLAVDALAVVARTPRRGSRPEPHHPDTLLPRLPATY